jgi:predicted transcriptional regulator
MSNTKTIRVKDVMRRNFLKIDGLKTVMEALQIMKAEEVNAIIVDKRHEGDEFGIVLLADIAKKVLAQDRSPDRINVYEVMSKPIISVTPEMDVRYCARLFEQFGLSVAPVVSEGEILGMVGYRGLVLNGLLEIHS